jgi:hypothetical protein
MAVILVATATGLRVFLPSGENRAELTGREVNALAPETGGSCVAVVDTREIWRRNAAGEWSPVASADIALCSIVPANGNIFAGANSDAVVVRVPAGGQAGRLHGFDRIIGREEWVGNGPPLHVRSLTATADNATILAAVHVGGIPRSNDAGENWSPTVPIAYDVHEVRAHPTRPNIVTAAAAVGLCFSEDAGRTWQVCSESPRGMSSLTVAMLPDEALFSMQDGPFASRSQVWRWRFGGKSAELVREGLPEWLEGKVDTGRMAAGAGRAAIVDHGGNLWVSETGSQGWRRLASGLPYVFGVAVL